MPRRMPGQSVTVTKEQLRQRFAAASDETAPQRRLTREERKGRNDSVLGSDASEQRRASKEYQLVKHAIVDHQAMPFRTRLWHVSTTYVNERVAALDALSQPSLERWARSSIWRKVFSTRDPQTVLLNVIALLLLISPWWVLIEYLSSTSRAAAACTASTSTIYIPYMETVTSTMTVSPSNQASSVPTSGSSIEAAAAGLLSTLTTSYTTVSTFTTTISHTTTITAPLSTTEMTVLSSSGGPSYFFHVTSGSTVWQNGISPSSGVSLTVATTSVYVVPMQPAAPIPSSMSTSLPTVTSTSTVKGYTTVTLPPYTSTVFSIMSPALTTTLTSTHYTTYSLAAVSSPSSFPGMNSQGWNVSSTDGPVAPATTTAPRLTKFTRLIYFGHDNITTSTSTMLVTATLGDTITHTLAAASSIILGNGASGAFTPDTTLTAEGITPTEVIDGAASAFSTSIIVSQIVESASYVPGSLSYSIPAASPSNLNAPATIIAEGPTSTILLTDTSGLGSTIGSSDFSSKFATTSTGIALLTSQSSDGQPLIGSATNSSAVSNSFGAPSFTITPMYTGYSTVLPVTTIAPSSAASSVTVIDGTTFRMSGGTIYQGGRPGTRSIPPIASSPQSSGFTGDATNSQSSVTMAATEVSSTFSTIPVSSIVSAFPSNRGSTMSAASVQSSSFGISAPPSTLIRSTSSLQLSGVVASSAALSNTAPSSTARSLLSSDRSSIVSLFTSNSSALTRATASTGASFSNPFPPTSATAIPTQGCGEQGDFNMDFDTLPTFSSGRARKIKRQQSWNGTSNGNGTSDITAQPPLSMRPYKHMLFSGGYVYSPQPVEPFRPASSPNVAVFLANGTGLRAGQKPNGLEPGEIADGPYHEGDPAFFFDAKSAQLGCDNAGPEDCTMEVTPYVWNNTLKDDVPAPAQNFTIPPCVGYQNCRLTPVTFPSTFRNLSGIQMRATRDGQPRMFFVDDLQMRWSDSSCESGMKRQESP